MKRISSNLLAVTCCATTLLCMDTAAHAAAIAIAGQNTPPPAQQSQTEPAPTAGSSSSGASNAVSDAELSAPAPAAAGIASSGAKTKGAPSGSQSASASIPNSSENFLGDRLSWSTAIEAKTTLSGTYAGGYCIPADTKVVGTTKAMSTMVLTTQDSNGNTKGTSAPQFQEVTLDAYRLFGSDLPDNVSEPDGDPKKITNSASPPHKTRYVPVPQDAATLCPDVSDPIPFDQGAQAFISSDDMGNLTYRAGFRYGALVVPFKMQLSGGKALTGSASLGGYLGYQDPVGDIGLNFTPVLFGGLSNISTSATTGSTTTSQTVAGLSYGAGLLFDVKDDFHIGLVLGFDHVSSAQKYQYNDKPWVSFEIGYSFAN